MAELIDTKENDVPDERRLRLSFVWGQIISDPDDADELSAQFSIGFFIGDRPLFEPHVYTGSWRPDYIQPGYFYAEDYGCYFLRDLWNTLRTGKRTDFVDTLHPSLRLVVAPELLLPGPTDDKEKWFDVLSVVRHGGLWHGGAMGGSGPAMLLTVTRPQLEKFFYDLLDEAIPVCNDLARIDLQEAFARPLAARHDHPQA